MTTRKDSWFDLSTLRLTDSGWKHGGPSIGIEAASGAEEVLLESAPQHRYIADLRVWMSDSACRLEFTPKGDARIACRGLGWVLDRLVQQVGADHVPQNLFFQAREGSFLARGLLSLWPLGSAIQRTEILSRHTLLTCGQEEHGEGWSDYENQAVKLVASRLRGYEELEPSTLRLKHVRSKPDGLFYNEDRGALVIVEAKKSRADWSDGAAQVLQYIGQARNHPRFQHADISTYLVVADDGPKEGYRSWERLMGSDRDFNIYIDGTRLAFHAEDSGAGKLRSA